MPPLESSPLVAGLSPRAHAAIEVWMRAPVPLRLSCGVQHYAWGQRGDAAFIPTLLGLHPSADGAEPDRAYAELWVGAHPMLPAHVTCDGVGLRLDELIAAAPDAVLGHATHAALGAELPFLMKVLAAAQPLSIQAHPNRAQAQAGFAREEALGIPRDAPTRNYRDRNHKPELIVALTPFFALSGFRPAHELVAALDATPELVSLAEMARQGLGGIGELGGGASAREALRRLFETCMAPDAGEVARGLAALVARLQAEDHARPFGPDAVEHWFLRAARELSSPVTWDRGLLAFFLLNFVRLQPGQALFLRAGELHAYLQGVGIEVMASSDNVLRGGLTPKHVDVAELARVLTFETAPAAILTPASDGTYATPAPEFETAALTVAPGAPVHGGTVGRGPAILLALEGEATLTAGPHRLTLRRGDAVLLADAVGAYVLTATGGTAQLFRTGVGGTASAKTSAKTNTTTTATRSTARSTSTYRSTSTSTRWT